MNAGISVVHVVPSIAAEASGPSYSVRRLCQSVATPGITVTLVTLAAPDDEYPSVNMKLFASGLGPKRLGRSPSMRRWLQEWACSDSIRILHNHSLWMMPNVYPGEVARRHGIPLVTAPRGTMSEWAMRNGSIVKKFFWPILQKQALDATACFHATSMSEYEDVRLRGFQQPVAIIPNGIDLSALPLAKKTDQRILLFLGRIHPVKGIDLLLFAWREIEDMFPAWSLQIAGPDNGGYLGQMQDLARSLKLKRVKWIGPLYGEAKLQAYRNADLFVLPTHTENFGMAVAEALAMETPAVVTKGAPWGGLEERGVGWWPEASATALTECLVFALNQPRNELEDMGRRGRMWMAEDYAWETIGKKMADTYSWILHGGTMPGWVIDA